MLKLIISCDSPGCPEENTLFDLQVHLWQKDSGWALATGGTNAGRAYCEGCFGKITNRVMQDDVTSLLAQLEEGNNQMKEDLAPTKKKTTKPKKGKVGR